MKPVDKKLYEKVKKIIYERYAKPSAYRSGAVIRLYKDQGGKFEDDGKPKKLKQWFNEAWIDINKSKTKNSYPVFRPTKRVNKTTPLTVQEIDKKNLIQQIKIKQKIKGTSNLKPFKKK